MPPTDDELLELAARTGAACRAVAVTLATAESCTGGLIAHLVTEVPRSSDYFRGSLVTYSNDAKSALADVPATTIEHHGAVSAQVAVAMAEGARRRLRAGIAVSVTGIAGPDGGSAAKPVGLTYIAIADDDGDDVRRFVWTGDRSANKRASAAAAMSFVIERLGARVAHRHTPTAPAESDRTPPT